ncbi:MAG: ImmA/IrrE family metallo-endopeptidase [Candidatus Sulfotelmatobacter sp.]|jgi:Zn-dependent peptidase ImmA (M78 family)
MMAVRAAFVRKMASKVLKESRIDTPPVDLVAILRKHGIEYEEVEDFPDSVDALIIEDDAKVYAAVNSRHHLHRRRFSLAHELGHHFLHKDGRFEEPITIDSPPSEEDEFGSKAPAEIEADLFAGELLVPLEMLKRHVKKGIPELSKIFLVSEQVVSIAISKHMNALFK